MAHWAELDENNIVIRVVVGSNDDPDEGYQWILDNLGGRWVQTSYNHNFRRIFASEGYKYDEILDIFIDPQPFLSWTFNENTLNWEAPEPEPDTSEMHYWDEDSKTWIIKHSIPDTGMWILNEESGEWSEYDTVH